VIKTIDNDADNEDENAWAKLQFHTQVFFDWRLPGLA
jgi:hypothetical protein